jgi:hypothetical protein
MADRQQHLDAELVWLTTATVTREREASGSIAQSPGERVLESTCIDSYGWVMKRLYPAPQAGWMIPLMRIPDLTGITLETRSWTP